MREKHYRHTYKVKRKSEKGGGKRRELTKEKSKTKEDNPERSCKMDEKEIPGKYE